MIFLQHLQRLLAVSGFIDNHSERFEVVLYRHPVLNFIIDKKNALVLECLEMVLNH